MFRSSVKASYVNPCHAGDVQVVKMGEVICMDRASLSGELF